MCANALLLRFCTNYAYSVSMLDETGFYAPSMAHNTLPSHPWLGISVFHVHNSTVSKQLRYTSGNFFGVTLYLIHYLHYLFCGTHIIFEKSCDTSN